MGEGLKISSLKICLGMSDAISLQGLVAGQKPCASPDGATDLFGAPLYLVSRGATPGNKREPMTVAISGRHSTGSYANSALSLSLANRLKQQLDLAGSMEYRLTWKQRATPSGRLYYQLVASERRTDDIEFSGWPTAQDDVTGRSAGQKAIPGTKHGCACLAQTAMSAYPTPTVPNGGCWIAHAEMKGGTAYHEGKKIQISLEAIAKLSSWVSPTAQDHSRGNQPPRETDTGIPLSHQVASWGTPASRDHKDGHCDMTKVGENGLLPSQVLGATSTSATSPTEKSGGLNPALSRWLQGYPKEWCLCAIRAYRKSKTRAKREAGDFMGMETQSSRKSRRNL